MLKKFEVEGFKNFDYPLIIDFSDIKQYSFNKKCIQNNLLKTMIVYGKNSIGKTNLGLAIFDIVTHLVDRNVSPRLYDYYLNNSGKYTYASFCYTFQFENVEIKYSYKKTSSDNIVFESIEENGELLFEYDNLNHTKTSQKHFISDKLKSEIPNLNFDYNDASISTLRYIVNNTPIDKNHPVRKIYDFVSNMLWFRNLDENRFIGLKDNVKKANDYFDFIFKGDNLKQFQDLLYAAGVEDQLIVRTTPENDKMLYIAGDVLLPFFRVASNGTKSLYAYFYWMQNKEISFLFIDEFDAYYHYELSKTIVKQIENKNHQTILTSHNTNLLSNDIMRPDCYFILTKTKAISIAKATDRELREGHNLAKLYMNGEFDES